MQSSKVDPQIDERIESLTNKYASHAFTFLMYYLVISVVIKGFTLDVNMYIYWDNVIVILLAFLYMIYRSAEEGATYNATTLNPINWKFIKGSLWISLLFGLFFTFYISGMVEHWDSFFSTIPIKIAGAVVISTLLQALTIFAVWLIDVIPTKRALRKAAELAGEPDAELPDDEELIKQSHIQDERIESINDKYAAHGFYAVVVYIMLSTMVKLLTLDVSLIAYYDSFVAAMGAAGYFSYMTLKNGIYEEPQLTKKDRVYNVAITAIGCLAFGMFTAFILIPMAENWAALLHTTGRKLIFGLLMAAFFCVGTHLISKAVDWYAKRQADRLSEPD